MHPKKLVMVCATLLLAACSSLPQQPPSQEATPAVTPTTSPTVAVPGSGGYLAGDGPDEKVPANLDSLPDAVPKAEPLHRYANRPYKALGKTYTPLLSVGHYKARGIASWYGKKFHGQRTSIGETYDMYAMSAAHTILPIPSYARVTNTANGKSVVVRINDRGPFMHDRIIDLSYAAAHKLDIIGAGSMEVEVESLSPDAVVSPAPGMEPVQNTPLENPPPVSAPTPAPAAHVAAATPAGVYLQLGAFKTHSSAQDFMEKMQHKLGHSSHKLALHSQAGLIRVQIGPYANANEAREAAEKLHGKLGVKPFVSSAH